MENIGWLPNKRRYVSMPAGGYERFTPSEVTFMITNLRALFCRK
jgi:hypothetical protein